LLSSGNAQLITDDSGDYVYDNSMLADSPISVVDWNFIKFHNCKKRKYLTAIFKLFSDTTMQLLCIHFCEN